MSEPSKKLNCLLIVRDKAVKMSNEISGNLEKLEIVEACKRLIVEVSVGM